MRLTRLHCVWGPSPHQQVSSLAEETKKPQRDMPLGILGSLIVAACVYVAVTLVVTGMVCGSGRGG